jgi:hypothetical protein
MNTSQSNERQSHQGDTTKTIKQEALLRLTAETACKKSRPTELPGDLR